MAIPKIGAKTKVMTEAPAPEPVGGPDDASEDALPVAPNAPFFYVLYPDDPGNWFVGYVEGEAHWLPSLNKLTLIPGTGGVRTLRKNEAADMAYRDALERITRRGGEVLPREHGYLVKTRARHPKTGAGGYLYHDRFEGPRVPRGRRKRTVKFDQDHEGRNAWLLSLVQQGYVSAPHPDIVDANIARLAERIYGAGDRRGISLPDDLEVLSDDQKANLPKVITQAIAARDEAADAKVPGFEAPPAAVPAKKPSRRRAPRAKAADADEVGTAAAAKGD